MSTLAIALPRPTTSMTALTASDFVVALPHLRRYARVLTGEAGKADQLLIDTVELAREAFPRQTVRAPLRTRLFALMHELHVGQTTPSRQRRAALSGLGPAAVRAPAKSTNVLLNFEQLPVEDREVLLLVAVEGMRYEEIASVLGVSVSTVVSRISRARSLMRSDDSDASGQTGARPIR